MQDYSNADTVKQLIKKAYKDDDLSSLAITCRYGEIYAAKLDTEMGPIGVARLDWNGVLGCMGKDTNTKEPQSPEYEFKLILAMFREEHDRKVADPDWAVPPDMEQEYMLFCNILLAGYIPFIIYNGKGHIPEDMWDTMMDLTDANEDRQLDILYLVCQIAQYEMTARLDHRFPDKTAPILEEFLSSEEDLVYAASALAAGYEAYCMDIKVDGYENMVCDYALGQTLQTYFFDRIGHQIKKELGHILFPQSGTGTKPSSTNNLPSDIKRFTPNDCSLGEMMAVAVDYKGNDTRRESDFFLLKNLAIECFVMAYKTHLQTKEMGLSKEQTYLYKEFSIVYGLLWNGFLPVINRCPTPSSYQPVFMKPVFEALAHNCLHYQRPHPEITNSRLVQMRNLVGFGGMPALSAVVCEQYLAASPMFHLF